MLFIFIFIFAITKYDALLLADFKWECFFEILLFSLRTGLWSVNGCADAGTNKEQNCEGLTKSDKWRVMERRMIGEH